MYLMTTRMPDRYEYGDDGSVPPNEHERALLISKEGFGGAVIYDCAPPRCSAPKRERFAPSCINCGGFLFAQPADRVETKEVPAVPMAEMVFGGGK